MVRRKIVIKKSVAQSIASIAWFIESKGMIVTAEKFSDAVYDFFEKLTNSSIVHGLCREPSRAALGFKCVPYKKKYTIVFIESDEEIIICEFLSSKMVHW